MQASVSIASCSMDHVNEYDREDFFLPALFNDQLSTAAYDPTLVKCFCLFSSCGGIDHVFAMGLNHFKIQCLTRYLLTQMSRMKTVLGSSLPNRVSLIEYPSF